MFFEKLFERRVIRSEKTAGQIYEELGASLDETMKDCLRIADVDLLEGALDLDEKSGALLGRAMKGYKEIMRLSAEMVDITDRQEKKINDISEQLDSLNKMLKDLNDKLTKLCVSMS